MRAVPLDYIAVEYPIKYMKDKSDILICNFDVHSTNSLQFLQKDNS